MIWLNGTLVDEAAARIGVADRGFLLGDGVFETLRFENGQVRRAGRHLARLKEAATTLGIAFDPDFDLKGIARELVRRNGLERAVIRLTLTRGEGGRGLQGSDSEPTLLMTASALPPAPEGLRLITLDAPRRAPLTLAAHYKLIGYGDNILARRMARARGGDMAVLLSPEGRVACTDSANLFWVTGRTIYTPATDTGALPGTTRAAILEAFALRGLHVEDGHFRRESLASADAVIVTNALFGAVSAATLDGRPLKTDHELARLICDTERDAG